MEVACPKCRAGVEIVAKHKDEPLWKLKCGICRNYLAKSPITVEFCIWLQNDWAEEIREQKATETNWLEKIFG